VILYSSKDILISTHTTNTKHCSATEDYCLHKKGKD